ncbi:YciI family protein [Acetobacteraceae bacterium KSS8]|uniref:YciI family protein n=1 Tax=Endosaccharibacter trunci TaxID=2812733 RepID=A0ABT1W230_9PROT|nr:YciI family protein [Acetobacteraceae bacterium KSS8]
MLFMILCNDHPGQGALRAETRETHLAYLAEQGEAIIHAGPLLDADGAAIGSLLVVEQPDQAAAEALAAHDPYNRAGLFASVSVRPHRLVIRNGRRVV